MTAATQFLRRHRWVPALAWAAAIMVVSSLPSPTIGPPLFPGCDKIAHFIEYLVLGAALSFWTGAGARASTSAASVLPFRERASEVVWVWVGWIGFAALDEVHQRFIPGREMSFWDFVADACGLVVGCLIWQRARRKGKQQE